MNWSIVLNNKGGRVGTMKSFTLSKFRGNEFVGARDDMGKQRNISIQEDPVEFNQARQTRLKTLKSRGPPSHGALALSDPKLNFLLCRAVLVEMESRRGWAGGVGG